MRQRQLVDVVDRRSGGGQSATTAAAAASATTAAAATSATTAPAAAGGGYGGYAAPPSSAPAAGASSAATTLTLIDSPHGKILADAQGHTLYIFTKDSPGTSACADACAKAWPPVTATGTPTAATGITATALSTITRADGTTQLAINGQPLYTYAGDAAPGRHPGPGQQPDLVGGRRRRHRHQDLTSSSSLRVHDPLHRGTDRGGAGQPRRLDR